MTTVVRKVITAIDKNGNAFSEVHTETQYGERWMQDDPTSLAQDSPELADWRTQYSGALEAERNALSADKAALESQVASLTTERDSLAADKQTLTDQVADLQAQLDALLNPPVNPRHVAPFDFLALFTQLEQVAIFSSMDPTVLVARGQLQTIITYVDLDLPATIGFVTYLEQAGLIGAGRAAQVLAREAPPA